MVLPSGDQTGHSLLRSESCPGSQTGNSSSSTPTVYSWFRGVGPVQLKTMRLPSSDQEGCEAVPAVTSGRSVICDFVRSIVASDRRRLLSTTQSCEPSGEAQ